MVDQAGPIQPMAATATQENFRAMVDHVLSYVPDFPVGLAKRRINTRLREVQDRRMWGGLMVRGDLFVPAVYSTGTVTVTNGSAAVTGSGTSWPVSDDVNTTLSSGITVVDELQDITPASMTNINLGDWLVIDSGGSQEVLLVISTTSTTFRAKPTKTHSSAVAITRSSLVRRQFRIGTTTSMYTVKAVTSTTALTLHLPWSHSSSSESAYQILKAYHHLGPNLRMIWSVVNNAQGWRLRLHMPQEVLDQYDTWRQTTGWTYMVADLYPDEVGRMMYELYPAPTSEQGLPYIALRTVPNLSDDEDTAPPCIPSHILVHGAIADALRWNRQGQYYDPRTAREFELQYERDLAAAVLADDSVYMKNLQWAYSRGPFHQFGAAYHQSHDWDSVTGVV